MQSSNITETDSILAQLKSQTAHQHQRTEDSVDLMREDFSAEDYKKLLARFYAFYKSFEPKMSDALRENPIELDYENRRNAPRLFGDLKSLGMSETAISEIESCGDLPALDSREKIFGALYVVEGSTLGGQVISRHLKEKFGFDESSGAAFFSGYGKETGAMWKNFREAITVFADGGANRAEIVGAANETFTKIGDCLSAE